MRDSEINFIAKFSSCEPCFTKCEEIYEATKEKCHLQDQKPNP